MDEPGPLGGIGDAIRRVAVINDEGREVAATIIGDWPLVL
jgi:hypothetical protein